MRVTTKTGDRGTTSLFGGDRVWKDSPIIEANGTIDELTSFLGEARHYLDDEMRVIIDTVQGHLYSIMAELGSKGRMKSVGDGEIKWLENVIAKYEPQVELRSFVLPGGTLASAKLDVCRAVARRAERRVATVLREFGIGEKPLIYLNRLSDLLFLMARVIEIREGRLREVKL
ncbi:cob(I)yrinic acid a,c-diamide adenosyltransferase [Pyrococcus yayanosii]|uniref:Cobalamin adenosyltransferase n=1 Tax=Pyrococcus yayanosii (strain CH1 / JCM 16557) TaxID=529709 RepID=F8AIJ5_PYRYC|nr:cob(I)yrinic acid a,c-diamide adenosyltransferase [Pyrococcus yayanosii]AEH24361.1 cobalamin adenosyltransferase [Pyrococcus yayanosii CH1]